MKVEWKIIAKLVCILTTTVHGHSKMKGCLAGNVKHECTMARGDVSFTGPFCSLNNPLISPVYPVCFGASVPRSMGLEMWLVGRRA
jgi:hypothetical protein